MTLLIHKLQELPSPTDSTQMHIKMMDFCDSLSDSNCDFTIHSSSLFYMPALADRNYMLAVT